MRTAIEPDGDHGDAEPDLVARRPEVVRRLLARGVPPRTLEALLPGWEQVIGESAPTR